jgi:hypothetical protein
MKIMTNAAVGAAVVIGLDVSVLPVQAAYVVDLTQEVIGGVNDVVANGSGTIDLTDLGSPVVTEFIATGITPNFPAIETGPANGNDGDAYSGITGPPNFGSGGQTSPSTGNGDIVGISGSFLVVPAGYVSGDHLSDTMTFDNATFTSLNVIPAPTNGRGGAERTRTASRSTLWRRPWCRNPRLGR